MSETTVSAVTGWIVTASDNHVLAGGEREMVFVPVFALTSAEAIAAVLEQHPNLTVFGVMAEALLQEQQRQLNALREKIFPA